MATTPTPQRPDVEACLRAADGPFGEVGHLAPTVRALVAWIRHLEAEAVELKDVIKVRDHEAREEIRRIRAGEID